MKIVRDQLKIFWFTFLSVDCSHLDNIAQIENLSALNLQLSLFVCCWCPKLETVL